MVHDSILISISNRQILCMKATKEGPRKILIIGTSEGDIEIRDAIDGLLLRTIPVPEKLKIYSLVLDGGFLYYGTNGSDLTAVDFTVSLWITKMEDFRIVSGPDLVYLPTLKRSKIGFVVEKLFKYSPNSILSKLDFIHLLFTQKFCIKNFKI